jgi:hypothetical protein
LWDGSGRARLAETFSGQRLSGNAHRPGTCFDLETTARGIQPLGGALDTSMANENPTIKARIERIRQLTAEGRGTISYYEAASLAQSVVHDAIGGSHPVMTALDSAFKGADYVRARAAARAVLALHDEGPLTSPRLAIAHEIEGSLLDIAQAQVDIFSRQSESRSSRFLRTNMSRRGETRGTRQIMVDSPI